MKLLKYALLAIPFLYFSCSDDEDAPEPINEEEVITTMTVYLLGANGDEVVMQTQDLDGDGPNEPVVTVSGPLKNEVVYVGAISWLNEMEDPAEDVTEEILEEADEHQVFFNANGVDMYFEYADSDSNGNPLGVMFVVAPYSTGSGSLTITLVHEPTKPNDGLGTAGGSIDIQTTFPVTVVQ